MSILTDIAEAKQAQLGREKKAVSREKLEAMPRQESRPFFRQKRPFYLIGECKKASPSAGVIEKNYSPAVIAEEYGRGGIGAISVLTEYDYFQGSYDHLGQVRLSVEAPVLRKDFLFDPYQILQSRAMGADIILLIASLLSVEQAQELAAQARELDMEVLLECHNLEEVEKYSRLGAHALGINARDLSTFEVSLVAAAELADAIPEDCVPVAESGIRSEEDAAAQAAAGFRGFLIGEYFMRAEDREGCVASMVSRLKEVGNG